LTLQLPAKLALFPDETSPTGERTRRPSHRCLQRQKAGFSGFVV